MADFEAITVTSVNGAIATNDGKHVLVRLDTAAQLPRLAFPVTEVPRLIDAICASLSTAMKTQAGGTVIVTTATWFEFGKGPQGQDVLGLTFGAGGKLWFQLPQGMTKNMYEVLGTVTGQSNPQTPDKPLN